MSVMWKEVSLGLQSQDEEIILKALDKLKQSKKSLTKEQTNKFIPRCVDKLQHHSVAIRAAAMVTITNQLKLENTALGPMADELCRQLSQPNMLDLKAGRDGGELHTELHTNLCTSIIMLQSRYVKKIMPRFKPIGNYLIDCTQEENKQIAAKACEYWAKLPMPPVPHRYMDIWIPVVLTKLQKLIPALINCMIYHPEYREFKQNIIPQTTRLPLEASSYVESMSNVRNYAALGFENLCKIFQTEVIAIFKPFLERYLNSDDWLKVEASILGLGAFTQALGTPRDMKEVYPDIIPLLIEKYSHPEPLVRSITCFTMQHFINLSMKGVKDPLPKIIKGTLALLEDELYETRTMALRSIVAIVAYSEKDLTPYNTKIVDALIRAGTGLKGEALYSYYECVGHLFGRSGDIIEDQKVTALMEPLMNHWRSIDVTKLNEKNLEDTVMICQPLCIIATYSKATFYRYNEAIFEKVASHIKSIIGQSNTLSLNDPATNNHLVAMIDVTSAIFEGQGPEVAELAKKYRFEHLALEVLREGDFQEKTHQSMLALLGHLAAHCFDLIEPHIDDYLDICKAKLRSPSEAVKNNNLWTLAGLAKGCTKKNEKLMRFLDPLAEVIMSAYSDQGQAINATLALTYLGTKWPQDVISIIIRDDVFFVLCTLLQMQFQRDHEKVIIFCNLCEILDNYLKKVPKELWAPFCTAIALCDCKDDTMMKTLQDFLRRLRAAIGNKGWNMVSNQIGPQLAVTLRKKYKLY
ncbi:hypothetical protein LSH36_165g05027 [Paralvinella palmiformis]|uniref:Uncharacterized protein n=1 Tax=Paralvinella palmiformis TaxID=53620 RepID=A0AAD9JT79_9ANNE|nr:hypothetical protein LSH36_165g05027 [Paralvinella palmiformis]